MAKVREGCTTAGIGCIQCKGWVADNIVAMLNPIQERRRKYENNPRLAWDILEAGSAGARRPTNPGRGARVHGHVAGLSGAGEDRGVADERTAYHASDTGEETESRRSDDRAATRGKAAPNLAEFFRFR